MVERYMRTKTNRPQPRPKRFKRIKAWCFPGQAGETEARNTKVRISILIDLDVLNFFKERALKAGAPAYQTQINPGSEAKWKAKSR